MPRCPNGRGSSAYAHVLKVGKFFRKLLGLLPQLGHRFGREICWRKGASEFVLESSEDIPNLYLDFVSITQLPKVFF